ncbi:protein prenylyltransferase [Laetiporus sulphureus 93-53]|uniref:Protein farnesyltransferase/geranylgeranyltransferase type-1 subunit alpha n=1 Tax=Laetiporus sulphureus 93-53 TaxID=1314785 RepID=A0A165EI29_9APHY|nr:protein prenylyltransferase [Laetiporus sulphureus 93-53]KZT07094.1 protein prenylyltransferase [Laetiporus sulphureus 93-53]
MSAAFEDERLYSERSEWADVVPIQQYQGIDPLAPINYSVEYQDATDYFRGIVKTGEMSSRVLQLTEHIIRMNPAHYSAWQYRYRTLLALNSSLEEELRLMDRYAIEYLKTYQVWHHRRLLLTALRSVDAAAAELAFIARALETDTKNYHTWSYRQWVLAHFNDEERLWAGERGWTDDLLEQDVRNNSAWHHRFFVVWDSGVRQGDEDREEVLRRELAFTKEKIALAPNNPSAWNYLRGVLERTQVPFNTLSSFVKLYISSVRPDPNDVLDLDVPPPTEGAELPSVNALEFQADIYEQEGGEQIGKAVEIWKSLGDEYDTMRKKYWEYRIREALQTK